ncbi:hypothetical protein AB0M43_16240 [Longispora sp. NPDC051575]|uniref:hypothetical protein n=1 Tax=Longispora sp. NPDC051575 TaxID=3154943 RepID=UPI003446BDA1
MSDYEELRAARRRFPTGDRVRGRVSAMPWPAGLTGLFVDLGASPDGFVDVLHLPEDPAHWPPVGRTGLFEVLQHSIGQVRLFPLDAGMRALRCRYSRWSGAEWRAITERYPVGSTVTGTVTAAFVSNLAYVVEFDDCWSTVEADGPLPEVGSTGEYTVTRLLEWTHRIRLGALSR